MPMTRIAAALLVLALAAPGAGAEGPERAGRSVGPPQRPGRSLVLSEETAGGGNRTVVARVTGADAACSFAALAGPAEDVAVFASCRVPRSAFPDRRAPRLTLRVVSSAHDADGNGGRVDACANGIRATRKLRDVEIVCVVDTPTPGDPGQV